MQKKSWRRKMLQLFASILTGGGIFFIYYASTNKHPILTRPLTTQEILDRAVNSSGIKETKSIKKEKNEIILQDTQSTKD